MIPRHVLHHRSAIGMLLLVALGTGCSGGALHLAAQDQIPSGVDATAQPADQPTHGTPAPTTSAPSTPRETPSAADPTTTSSAEETSPRIGPTPPTAIGSPMSEFPIVLNQRVKLALKYLQMHRSAGIAQAFWRARRYAGMMRTIFREHGLPKETRHFVPKFMAMTIISRDPNRYGFSPPPEEPHDTEVLHVSQPTEIRDIAEAAGTTVRQLRDLNPELVGSATPSDEPRYALRIPRRVTWVSHKVQKGETLATIARRYKVSPQILREANKLYRSDDLTVGRVLLVPTEATPPPA